jgi:Na+-driven multidrug efflux pump
VCIHDDMLTNSLLVENSGEEASRDSVLWQAVQNTRFSRDPEPKAPAPCSAAPVSEDVPPFSVAAEIRLFFRQGVPLVLSSFLEWGVPPLAAMVIAGHVKEGSTALQASIGFARIFYTVTYKMPCIALLAYMRAVIPGCVGAGRADRIPKYFQRSMVLSLCLTIPSLVLQLFASPILRSVNVPDDIARAVGE